jgi:hypothetical protein
MKSFLDWFIQVIVVLFSFFMILPLITILIIVNPISGCEGLKAFAKEYQRIANLTKDKIPH